MNKPKDADRDSCASHCSSALSEIGKGLEERHERERREGLKKALEWRMGFLTPLWYEVIDPDGNIYRIADKDSAMRLIWKMNKVNKDNVKT